MDPRCDQKIPRPLRTRGRQNRCLKLRKALVDHATTQTRDDLTPQHNVRVELLATKIQKTILQADLFGVLGVPENWKRNLGGLRKQLDSRRLDLNLSRRYLRIDSVRTPRSYLSLDAHDRLELDPLDELKGLTVSVDDHLGNPVMVPQIDKQ